MNRMLKLTLCIMPFLIGCSGYYEWEVVSESEVIIEDQSTTVYAQSYTPLHVGDVRQVVSTEDGGTILYEIVGTTYRSDGQQVYIERETWGTDYANPTTSYVYSDGSYMIYTELDILTDEYGDLMFPGNPYAEQRVALSFPRDGKLWLDVNGDPLGVWWQANYYGSYSSPGGLFYDVYAFESEESDEYGDEIVIYYAPEIGWCGTGIAGSLSKLFTLSYANIGGERYGFRRASRDMVLAKKTAGKKIDPFGRRHR